MARKASSKKKKSTPKANHGRGKGEFSIIFSVVIFALACLGMYTPWIGKFGDFIKLEFKYVFGVPAYIVPATFILVCIHIARFKNAGKAYNKYWLTLTNLFCISALCSTLFQADGGALGALIADPMKKNLGTVGSTIVLTALIIAFSSIVFDFSFINVVKSISAKLEERRLLRKLEKEYEYEEEEEIETLPEVKQVKTAPPFVPTNADMEPLIQAREDIQKIKAKKEKKEKKGLFGLGKKAEDVADMGMLEAPVALNKTSCDISMIVDNQNSNEITKDMYDINISKEEQDEKKREAVGEIITAVSRNKYHDIQYPLPSSNLLDTIKQKANLGQQKEVEKVAEKLIRTLANFKIIVKIKDWFVGPTVTRYELEPAAGVKISKITNLADDIAMNLAASGVRIEAPIPGKSAVGIEVPNKNPGSVPIKEVLDSKEFTKSKSKLAFCLGKNIAGEPIVADVARMPHLLVAGATGSGKSVCVNSIITSILYRALPSEVNMILIDPKMVELSRFSGIPHLLVPVVTDSSKAAGALAWAVKEMDGRYKQFNEIGVRDIAGYNSMFNSSSEIQKMPEVVIVIDELADLMATAPADVEQAIHRLSSKARAAGMYLIVATQRPSTDVITGVIKANIPSRISFAVSSGTDSRVILDCTGAEKLIGKGDMLYAPIGCRQPMRIQGCFVSDKEVEKVVNYVIAQAGEAEYDDEVTNEIEKFEISKPGRGVVGKGEGEEKIDKLDERFEEAVEFILNNGTASTSSFQRYFNMGYQRASKLIDQLENKGIIGHNIGTKPREVLINRNEYFEMRENGSFDVLTESVE